MEKLLIKSLCLMLLFSCSNERSSKSSKSIGSSITKKEFREITEELNIFSDFEDYGGTVIYDKDSKTRSLAHIKKDSLHIIFLEKINEGDIPTRQILDTIHFVSNSENYYTDLLECEDIEDPNRQLIFGFYVYEDGKEYFNKIVFAWRVNLKNDRLETINPKGIKCSNIGYGL